MATRATAGRCRRARRTGGHWPGRARSRRTRRRSRRSYWRSRTAPRTRARSRGRSGSCPARPRSGGGVGPPAGAEVEHGAMIDARRQHGMCLAGRQEGRIGGDGERQTRPDRGGNRRAIGPCRPATPDPGRRKPGAGQRSGHRAAVDRNPRAGDDRSGESWTRSATLVDEAGDPIDGHRRDPCRAGRCRHGRSISS